MSAPLKNKNALGNEGGRPTKMPKDLIKRSEEYLKQCVDDLEEVIKQVREEGSQTTTKKEVRVNLPSLAGLARWMDVSRETIYEWQRAKIEFSDVCSKILAEQEKRLLDKGLAGLYNPNITKLLLTKHGYSEKTETDITSKGERIESINYIVPSGNQS